MDIFSLRLRRTRLALACFLLVPGALAVATITTYAGAGAIKVDRQAWNWDDPGVPNPYQGPNDDGNLHVAMANSTQESHALVHLDFSALPTGAQISELDLTMVQNTGAPSDTASSLSQQPGLRACVLLQPFTASNTSAKWDCSRYPYANGSFDSAKNTWTFDLQPLASAWDSLGNTGAAIVPRALPPPGTAGPTAPGETTNWSITLVPSGSKATVDYSPGSSSSQSSSAASAPVFTGLTVAPPAAPATVPPVPKTAPPAAAAQTAPSGPVGVVPLSKIQTSRLWVGIAAGLVGLALLLVVGGALLNLVRGGTLSLAGAGAALSASWPSVATPAALILMGAVLAGGFSGRVITVAAPGSVSGGAAGGASGGAVGANGQPLAGAAATGGSAGSLAGPSGPASTSGGSAAGGYGSNGLPQGVSPTSVKIGFFHVQNANAQNAAVGVAGHTAVGSDQDQANAMVDWINKHGGLAGHRVVPVFVNVNGADTDPTYPEQLCTQMTEDEKVFAVVDGGHAEDREANCYIQHHTLWINDGLAFFPEQFLMNAAPYMWQPEMMSMDRAEMTLLSALNAKNFFTAPNATSPIRVGMLFPNIPSTEAVVQNLVVPTLERFGVSGASCQSNPTGSCIDTATFDEYSGDEAAALSQINSAALKFKTENINRVMFPNDIGAADYIFFARDADAQQYTSLEYGLDSQDGLDAVGYLVPTDEKTNTVSVGWWSWSDTSQANSMGFPDSPAEANCYQIMNQHGIYSSQGKGHERDAEGTLQMDGYCDDMLALYYAGLNLGQNLNAANLTANLERLGSSFQSAVVYPNGTYLGPRHHDGTDLYRYIIFDVSCTTGYNGGTNPQGCFKYADQNFYKAPEV